MSNVQLDSVLRHHHRTTTLRIRTRVQKSKHRPAESARHQDSPARTQNRSQIIPQHDIRIRQRVDEACNVEDLVILLFERVRVERGYIL